MEQSDSIKEIATALSKCQGAIPPIKKLTDNPWFKSKYADLATIWEAIRKPLCENGLSIVQATNDVENKINLTTIILHSSGEWISSTLSLTPTISRPKDGDSLPVTTTTPTPQGMGSALTYARRYALSAMLGIASEEDDDGEAASGRGKKKETKPAEAPESITKDHFCTVHNQPFTEIKKGDNKWWSHRTSDGKWCNEKSKGETAKEQLFGGTSQDEALKEKQDPEQDTAPRTTGLHTAINEPIPLIQVGDNAEQQELKAKWDRFKKLTANWNQSNMSRYLLTHHVSGTVAETFKNEMPPKTWGIDLLVTLIQGLDKK
uniref:Putative Erf family protein n=1 Tax=viral metagenome TaxID=1070528 RepID=A0A6M3JIS2_9ZZZZ